MAIGFNCRAFKDTAINKDTTLNSAFSAFRVSATLNHHNDRKWQNTHHVTRTTKYIINKKIVLLPANEFFENLL